MTNRPNFVFITTDQHRADCLGCYGNDFIQTPYLDRLAAEGVLVERAYVNHPLCMPSRSTLLTGRYPRSHGVWCNGVPLRSDEVFFSQVLSEAGYHTAFVGKMHFTPFGGRARPDFYDTGATWEQADLRSWNGPYYGFEEVHMTIGHCNPRAGHWGLWLKDNHPDSIEPYAVEPRNAQIPPSGVAATWRSTLPVEAHHSTWIGHVTAEYIQRKAAAEQPFFVWASFPDPHHPFRPPAEYADKYEGQPVQMPLRRTGELDDKPPHFRRYHEGHMHHEGAGFGNPSSLTDEQMRDIIRYTYAMITLVDNNVGRILDAIDKAGLRENTVVCFISDHGELLGDHGLMCKGPFHYEGLLRVPMIWRYPGHFPARDVREGLCGFVDFAPTIYELAGVGTPMGTQGESLVPMLRGDKERHRDWVLVEFQSGYRSHLNLKTLITPQYKLNYYGSQPYGELYDLYQDPNEFVNLYHRPDHAEVRRGLVNQLLDALLATEDRRPVRLSHA